MKKRYQFKIQIDEKKGDLDPKDSIFTVKVLSRVGVEIDQGPFIDITRWGDWACLREELYLSEQEALESASSWEYSLLPRSRERGVGPKGFCKQVMIGIEKCYDEKEVVA